MSDDKKQENPIGWNPLNDLHPRIVWVVFWLLVMFIFWVVNSVRSQ